MVQAGWFILHTALLLGVRAASILLKTLATYEVVAIIAEHEGAAFTVRQDAKDVLADCAGLVEEDLQDRH